MKVMVLGFVAALVIAALAPVALEQFGWSTADQYSSENVRLD